LGILISFYITRSIGKPVALLGQKTKEIASGKFQKISGVQSPPEIKQLAEDFNFMSERLEQLDNMKLDFISHVSHELRTPLTSIKAASSILLEGAFDGSPERQKELLAVSDLRQSRRLVICEPLKAVVYLGPPQRWRLFA
jgi:two-component system sensor histidine kinase GlrK